MLPSGLVWSVVTKSLTSPFAVVNALYCPSSKRPMPPPNVPIHTLSSPPSVSAQTSLSFICWRVAIVEGGETHAVEPGYAALGSDPDVALPGLDRAPARCSGRHSRLLPGGYGMPAAARATGRTRHVLRLRRDKKHERREEDDGSPIATECRGQGEVAAAADTRPLWRARSPGASGLPLERAPDTSLRRKTKRKEGVCARSLCARAQFRKWGVLAEVIQARLARASDTRDRAGNQRRRADAGAMGAAPRDR